MSDVGAGGDGRSEDHGVVPAAPPAVPGAAPGTERTVRRFQDAWNAHDVAAVMALMTDDCVFESTWPPPDGERVAGHDAVRAFWQQFFAQSPEAWIEIEELVACGDRATMRWRYRWGGGTGHTSHVRGVDVYRIRDGKVAEKLSYVKG